MPHLSSYQITERMKAFAAPTWGYRRLPDGSVDKDLFDGALPAGWAATPADLPAAAAPKPAQAPTAPGYQGMTFPQLSALLKERTGRGAKIGTPREEIIAALDELDAVQG